MIPRKIYNIPVTINFGTDIDSDVWSAILNLPQVIVDCLANGNLIFSASFGKSPNTEYEILSLSIITVDCVPIHIRKKPQIEI